MTTSQTPFLSDVLGDGPIPPGKLAYFRRRLSNRIHSIVLTEFARLESEDKINRTQLAKRIGRKPEQVTRWLGASGNWTVETLSDLLLAMKCEPIISVFDLAQAPMASESAKVVDMASFSRREVTFKDSKGGPTGLVADVSAVQERVANG